MNNTVELIDWAGSDLSHGLAAWTSTSRELTPEKRARLKDHLFKLARAKKMHSVPFEKSYLQFLVETEVASHIHMLKHRIAVSINGESARYRELKRGNYYVPNDWPEDKQQLLRDHYAASEKLYHSLCDDLTPVLGRKRTKESARFVLPYGHQMRADISFNFLSFMHFQRLRNDPDAQKEIEWIAQRMLELVRETGAFGLSLEAFGY